MNDIFWLVAFFVALAVIAACFRSVERAEKNRYK